MNLFEAIIFSISVGLFALCPGNKSKLIRTSNSYKSESREECQVILILSAELPTLFQVESNVSVSFQKKKTLVSLVSIFVLSEKTF